MVQSKALLPTFDLHESGDPYTPRSNRCDTKNSMRATSSSTYSKCEATRTKTDESNYSKTESSLTSRRDSPRELQDVVQSKVSGPSSSHDRRGDSNLQRCINKHRHRNQNRDTGTAKNVASLDSASYDDESICTDNESYCSDAESPSSTGRSLRRPARIKLLFGLIAMTLFVDITSNFQGVSRILKEIATRLAHCKKCKKKEHRVYSGSWENLFKPARNYLQDDRAPVTPMKTNIGYVVQLHSCPENMADSSGDPGHAFYDAMAMLQYIISDAHEGDGGDLYSTIFYAIVHKDAITCQGKNGGTYDRVKALEDLGYWVKIWGPQIESVDEIQDPYLAANVHLDRGLADLNVLNAWSFEVGGNSGGENDIIVLVNYGTLMLKAPNQLFTAFLASPTTKTMFSKDYAEVATATGDNSGVNMGFFVLKPDATMVDTLHNEFKTLPFNDALGWDSTGVVDFEGAMGARGIMTYHFRNSAESQVLNRCVYSNSNEDPLASGACRDGEAACEDCRVKSFADIYVARMDAHCGAPWTCPYDNNWVTENSLCINFLTRWFSRRLDFEASFLSRTTAPTGTFHPEIFQGFCSSGGAAGYQSMLPDMPATAAPTPAPGI